MVQTTKPEGPKPARRLMSAVQEQLLRREGARARRANYFLLERSLPVGSNLPIPRQKVRAERPTVLVFADDAPLYNWAHACRYLLHDAESGELYREVAAQFPPFAGERDTPKEFRPFHQAVVFAGERIHAFVPARILRPRATGNRYAVLFSGMSNNRHTNDLEFLYRTLRDCYGYRSDDIYVLNHDGSVNYDGDPKPVTAWPGDSSSYRMPVNGAGSKAKLLGALDQLKKRLKSGDTLLIHTNNHGGHNGTESDLCCYPNWDSLGVAEFADKLAELPKFRCLIVMMEQCHSGGFNNAVIAKSTAASTSVASACDEFKNSIGGPAFDPFARDWIAAMTGADPYGHALDHDPDTNGDGTVSAREAFAYADSIHDPYDTPVFTEVHGGGGCRLGGPLFPRIEGLVWEEIVRKFWPEPDPLVVEHRVAAVVSQIDAIEQELGPRLRKLREEYEQRITAIVRAAKQIA